MYRAIFRRTHSFRRAHATIVGCFPCRLPWQTSFGLDHEGDAEEGTDEDNASENGNVGQRWTRRHRANDIPRDEKLQPKQERATQPAAILPVGIAVARANADVLEELSRCDDAADDDDGDTDAFNDGAHTFHNVFKVSQLHTPRDVWQSGIAWCVPLPPAGSAGIVPAGHFPGGAR